MKVSSKTFFFTYFRLQRCSTTSIFTHLACLPSFHLWSYGWSLGFTFSRSSEFLIPWNVAKLKLLLDQWTDTTIKKFPDPCLSLWRDLNRFSIEQVQKWVNREFNFKSDFFSMSEGNVVFLVRPIVTLTSFYLDFRRHFLWNVWEVFMTNFCMSLICSLTRCL